MKQPSYKYYTAKKLTGGLQVELGSLDEFIRFAESNQQKTIFIYKGNDASSYFVIVLQGGLFLQHTEGYELLEDFLLARKAGFPEAASYYHAKQLNCDNYTDYLLVKDNGVQDPDIIRRMKTTGFIDRFADFTTLRKTNNTLPEETSMDSPYAVFKFATDNGFTSYDTFEEALKAGFSDASEYGIAREKGYDNRQEYQKGVAGAFLDAREYREAQSAGAVNRQEYLLYKEFEQGANHNLSHDERLLLGLLSLPGGGKKVSINRLYTQFQEQLDKYRQRTADGQLPTWFRSTLPDEEAVTAFLLTNDHVKAFGSYDPDGEYFEFNRLQDRKVVIDGSNVAYNSQVNKKGIPQVENLLRMVRKLHENGIRDILIVVDASLKHSLSDPEKLKELTKLAEYLEAPSDVPADLYILEYVKNNRCLLVSNDTFREWKRENPWVFQHIDYYRLTFMIDGEAVLIPELERKADTGSR